MSLLFCQFLYSSFCKQSSSCELPSGWVRVVRCIRMPQAVVRTRALRRRSIVRIILYHDSCNFCYHSSCFSSFSCSLLTSYYKLTTRLLPTTHNKLNALCTLATHYKIASSNFPLQAVTKLEKKAACSCAARAPRQKMHCTDVGARGHQQKKTCMYQHHARKSKHQFY